MKKKKRTVSYSLYEVLIVKQYYNFKIEQQKEIIHEWMNPTEFAALKRTNKWKDKVSCKKLSTIKIELSL